MIQSRCKHSCYRFVLNNAMKAIYFLLILLLFFRPVLAEKNESFEDTDKTSVEVESEFDEEGIEAEEVEGFDEDEFVEEGIEAEEVEGFGEDEFVEEGIEAEEFEGFDEDVFVEEDVKTSPEETSLWTSIITPARFTVKHELSYKTESPEEVVNNRSSFRLEYAKSFGDYFFLQLDTKMNAFWGNDHRAEAEDKDNLLEPNTKEAFLQVSFGNTSIKAGIQVIIWGESDGGAITDVISPRDDSELFFISLEESRIGQAMVVLDQFTSFGDFSLFLIPDPEYDNNPEENTAYYYDSFAGQAIIRDETSDDDHYEYGMRWKKTFGKSDIALMVANLIENDYAYHFDGFSGAKMVFSKISQRFTMVGMTFNYARGNFLYKGEMGKKTPQTFYDAAFDIVEKDVFDTALGLEYSPGGSSYTLSVEIVNNHVLDWEEKIKGSTPENTNSIVFTWSKTFLNEDLSVDWMSSYSQPYISYLHSLQTSYTWSDNVKFEFNAFYPDIKDEDNDLWVYRHQKQLAFKVQYQF